MSDHTEKLWKGVQADERSCTGQCEGTRLGTPLLALSEILLGNSASGSLRPGRRRRRALVGAATKKSVMNSCHMRAADLPRHELRVAQRGLGLQIERRHTLLATPRKDDLYPHRWTPIAAQRCPSRCPGRVLPNPHPPTHPQCRWRSWPDTSPALIEHHARAACVRLTTSPYRTFTTSPYRTFTHCESNLAGFSALGKHR